MKIYFRRAKVVNPNSYDVLPVDLIIEFVPEDKFSDLHRELPGWEQLEQAEFDIEFAKNEPMMTAFLEEKERKDKELRDRQMADLQAWSEYLRQRDAGLLQNEEEE